MTNTQYTTIVGLLRHLDERVDLVERRLAHQFPTAREMRAQIDAELNSILAPGGNIKVFADE